MYYLFKLLGIGEKVSVSRTDNGRMLICVGTKGVKIFDLDYSNGDVIPAEDFCDAGSMFNMRHRTEEWQADTVAHIIREFL